MAQRISNTPGKPAASAPRLERQRNAAQPAPARAAKPFQPGSSGLSELVHDAEHLVDLGERAMRTAIGDVEHGVEGELGLTPYPGPAERGLREASIDAKVAKMDLQPGAQQALALLAARHVSPVDIWQGSHCIAQGDGGALYDALRALPGAEARTSSHYPGVHAQQYGIRVGGAELLFGTTADGSTWFQMEAHAFHNGVPRNLGQLDDNVNHLLDFAKYRVVNQNVGPLGTSPHTEHADPVRVG